MSSPVHVIALSGGKDSTAMALELMVREPRDYQFICNATGNELPELFAHLDSLAQLLQVEIKRVGYKSDLYGLIDEVSMLPNFRARFCTRILKIEPTIEYFETLPSGSILYVGLRADEPMREGLYGEDLVSRFPLREWGWGLSEVLASLVDWGVSVPARTDCAVCPFQRIADWHRLWRDYPSEYAKGVDCESRHGHTFRSSGRDTWSASLSDLGAEFASGRKVRPYVRADKSCRVCSL